MHRHEKYCTKGTLAELHESRLVGLCRAGGICTGGSSFFQLSEAVEPLPGFAEHPSIGGLKDNSEDPRPALSKWRAAAERSLEAACLRYAGSWTATCFAGPAQTDDEMKSHRHAQVAANAHVPSAASQPK